MIEQLAVFDIRSVTNMSIKSRKNKNEEKNWAGESLLGLEFEDD